jgi:site-specific recombinase XerD
VLVAGKGRRDRVVPLGALASWIERYLRDIRPSSKAG